MTLIEVKFILRNGVIIETKCENMSIKQTYGGEFTGYSMDGIKGTVPQYIDCKEIVAITTERKEYEND